MSDFCGTELALTRFPVTEVYVYMDVCIATNFYRCYEYIDFVEWRFPLEANFVAGGYFAVFVLTELSSYKFVTLKTLDRPACGIAYEHF